MSDDQANSPVRAEPDWTQGPAKWIAVAILGCASITGMVWSIGPGRSVTPQPRIAEQRTAQSVEPTVPRASGETGDAVVPPASLPRSPVDTTIININTATAGQLELLPGIGPSLASRIIAYRDEHGPFASVDELDRVKGIGSRTLERIRAMVKVAD